MWVFHHDTLAFLAVNEAAIRHYGYTRADFLSMTILDIRPSDEQTRLQSVLDQGPITNGLVHYGGWVHRKKDGTLIEVEVARHALQWEGQPASLVLIRDVTEQRRAEAALRASEERYRLLAETAQDMIFVITLQGTIEYVNHYAATAVGHSPQELVGKSAAEVFPAPTLQHQRDNIRRVAETRAPLYVENPTPFPQGVRWLGTWLTPLPDEHGHIRSVLGISRDVTDRVRASEQLQRSNEQLRGLASRVATTQESERRQLSRELHDQIGPNLTALNLNLSFLQTRLKAEDSVVRERLADSLKLVTTAMQRMRDVMADLRPPELDDYGLLAALRRYGAELGSRAGLAIHVKGRDVFLTPEIGIALFRIAQEALTNVVRHAHAQQANVTLQASPETLQLTITDDGRGFDPHATPPNRWGLINMRERALSIGGKLKLVSSPGSGTTIQIESERDTND